VWLVAGVVALVHVAVATRYGWHHDEFYYVISGRHLAWGYVDQPPLVPLMARLAAALPGGVLPLRVLAVAAQAACVLLAAILTAEFGGRRRAQIMAATAIGACPVFVGASLLFGTTVTDQVAWLALFVLVARALRQGTTRAWLPAGVVAGVGLENKDTIAVLLAGIIVGLVVFRKNVLRTAGPWLAGGIAAVVAAPNVAWDALHGWPNLAMAHALAAKQGGPLGALAQVPLLAILAAGPPLVVLWIIGVRWLVSPAGREHRWVVAVSVVTVVVFTASSGKEYYSAPLLAGLFSAGAVRVETTTALGRRGWPAAIAISALIAILIELPVLPATAANVVNPQLMQTYGWPQFVDQVTRAAATLPANTPIFASDYGEAGSLTILGPRAGLHNPIYSGHNNYTLWGPPPGEPDTVLCVGKFAPTSLHRFWSQVHEIAPITLPDGLRTSDVTQHAAIYLCQQPHGSWAQLWPQLRHFD
jgi:hypothetical protein